MPEDRKDTRTPATAAAAPRLAPREPSGLRDGLMAADAAHAVRRVAPAQASNDGNLDAPRRDAQTASRHDVRGAGRPGVPLGSNDGKMVQTPPVRERRVPPSGSAAAPAVARSGIPRLTPRGGRRPDDDSLTDDSYPSGSRHPGEPAKDFQGRARATPGSGQAPDPRAAAARSGAGTPGSGARPDGSFAMAAPGRSSESSAFRDGGHDGGQGGHGSSAPERRTDVDDEESYFHGEDGFGHDDDGPDFEPIPEPSDYEALSGRTGREHPDESGRVPLAARTVTEMKISGEKQVGASEPSGPDFDRKRMIVQAMESAVDRRREIKRQRAGADEAGAPGAEAPAGGPTGGPRMSTLLQTVDTHAKYLARGKQLLKRYKRENGVHFADEDVDPREFVAWTIGLRPFLSASSWRVYRLAVSAMIQTIPHVGLDEAIATLMGSVGVEDESRPVYRVTRDKNGGNTSAVRAKRMDLTHFRKLRSSLRHMTRSNKVDWLDDWLVAGIHTGLRPGEWPLASLEIRRDEGVRRVWLHVVNGKATQGRGNGTYRTLDISSYTDETLEAIDRMVRRSEQWAIEGTTSQRQSDCAQIFYNVCNTLFPRMQMKYSLYSLRHQFIANMKTLMTHAQVATLVGHISVETQVEHYGKRRSAWAPSDIREIPRPMDDQVSQVQKYLTMFEERAHLKMMQKAFAEGRDLTDDFDGPEDEVELVLPDADT